MYLFLFMKEKRCKRTDKNSPGPLNDKTGLQLSLIAELTGSPGGLATVVRSEQLLWYDARRRRPVERRRWTRGGRTRRRPVSR